MSEREKEVNADKGWSTESAYPATPCDCLVSELGDMLEGNYLTLASFRQRVRQWKDEVEWGETRYKLTKDDAPQEHRMTAAVGLIGEHCKPARFDLGFYIGPCTEEEAIALGDAILEMAEFKTVHGGGISMNKVDENYDPLPWEG